MNQRILHVNVTFFNLSIQYYLKLEEKKQALQEEKSQYEARQKVQWSLPFNCIMHTLQLHIFLLKTLYPPYFGNSSTTDYEAKINSGKNLKSWF